MAWSTPLTAVANTALNASQWNASVRDNLAETAAAKATATGRWFVSTGTNALAERVISQAGVITPETTGTTTYTNLTTNGPILSSVTTGTMALVMISARLSNTSVAATYSSFEVTGATTIVSSDDWAVVSEGAINDLWRIGASHLITVTSGANTFRMQYRVVAGTGSFASRKMQVMAL